MYTYIYIYIYIYIYTHTHTHTYIYKYIDVVILFTAHAPHIPYSQMPRFRVFLYPPVSTFARL